MTTSWIERTNEFFENLRLWDLGLDEAYLRIKSNGTPSWIYELSSDCDRCPWTKLAHVMKDDGNATILKVNTADKYAFKIFKSDQGKYVYDNETSFICVEKPDMGEFGVYDLTINEGETCEWKTSLEPVNIYLSMIVWISLIIAFVLIYKALTFGYRKFKQRLSNELPPLEVVTKKRLKSLDTFRGISIVIMIFVNSGGGGYWWIEHAHWDGLHLADLVFPWFLWIMGVCIPMSVKSQLMRTSRLKIFLNVTRRSITLFAIGFFLNTVHGPAFSNVRTFGVLQRFGIAYFFVATLMIIFMSPDPQIPSNNMKRLMFDVIQLTYQYCIALCLIVIYLCIVFFLPVPDCSRGYLGPGGKHNYFENPHCPGGATGYIDRIVLDEKHIYQWPTTKKVYEAGAFDPEGVLGCMPTIIQVLLGVQAGMILLHHVDHMARMKRWITWGVSLLFISGCLCGFSQHGGIPINKNLWSLSFVCITAGLANLLLTFCYFFIDVKQWWTDAFNPFLYPGMNAIVMYVGHSILHMMPFRWRFDTMNTHFLRLTENSWNTIMWVLVSIYLYENNTFYSI